MSNSKEHTQIQNIGNPALIATALAPAIQQNAPAMIKTTTGVIKTVLIILGVSGGAFLIYKWASAQRRKQIMAKAGVEPDIKATIDIYNAIPSGLKKGEGGIFNPFGLISDLGNKIATIWQSADTKRILDISKRITDNKRVFKLFRILYDEDLYQLLSKVLSPEDLDLFMAHSGKEHSASTTPAMPKNNIILTTKSVRIRKTPINQEAIYSNSSIWDKIKNSASEVLRRYTESNIIGTAELDKFIGITTGREVADEEGKTVFVEFYGAKFGKLKWDTVAYVWKGGIRVLTKEQAIKEFGSIENMTKKRTYFLNPSKLSGIETGTGKNIKSTLSTTIYDENFYPLSSVDKDFFLGKAVSAFEQDGIIYIKFITQSGTERFIDARCVEEL
jgi:hypothetical protein